MNPPFFEKGEKASTKGAHLCQHNDNSKSEEDPGQKYFKTVDSPHQSNPRADQSNRQEINQAKYENNLFQILRHSLFLNKN